MYKYLRHAHCSDRFSSTHAASCCCHFWRQRVVVAVKQLFRAAVLLSNRAFLAADLSNSDSAAFEAEKNSCSRSSRRRSRRARASATSATRCAQPPTLQPRRLLAPSPPTSSGDLPQSVFLLLVGYLTICTALIIGFNDVDIHDFGNLCEHFCISVVFLARERAIPRSQMVLSFLVCSYLDTLLVARQTQRAVEAELRAEVTGIACWIYY